MSSTFEEACHASHGIVTAEKLRTLGVAACGAEYRAVLAAHGWTPESIVAEARRRMHEKIANWNKDHGFKPENP